MKTIQDTRVEKTYFHNNPRHGRTTTLVDSHTKEILIVVMGAVSRRSAYRCYVNEHPARKQGAKR